MIVGVPKEIKSQESRVAITPEGVSEFVRHNHVVLIEKKRALDRAQEFSTLITSRKEHKFSIRPKMSG